MKIPVKVYERILPEECASYIWKEFFNMAKIEVIDDTPYAVWWVLGKKVCAW